MTSPLQQAADLSRRIDRAIDRELARQFGGAAARVEAIRGQVAAASPAPPAARQVSAMPLAEYSYGAEDYSQAESDAFFAAHYTPGPTTRVDLDD